MGCFSMKKKLTLSLVLLLTVSMIILSVISVTADTFLIHNDVWKLEIPSATNTTEYYLEAYLGTDTEIRIPALAYDRRVTKINDYAFLNNDKITSCILSHTLVEIESGAFYGCTNLKSISVPETIEKLGSNTFYGCISLESVSFDPDTALKSIPVSCFNKCISLVSVTLSNGIESIGNYAFYGCEKLTSIVIPPSVNSIADNAFEKCDLLTIRGWDGTYAEEFAKANNIDFISYGVWDDSTKPAEPTEVPTTVVVTEAPTVTAGPTLPTEVTEVPTTVTDVTDPTESVAPTFVTDVTNPAEPTAPTSVTDVTDPTESQVPTSITTVPTEPTGATGLTTPPTTVFVKPYIIGDADLSDKVTISDATAIQKYVAQLIDFNNDQKFLANVDATGGITIKDATAIQKYLADFPNIPYVGTEVYF